MLNQQVNLLPISLKSAKQGLSDGFSAAKEKVSEGVEAVSEATAKSEPRVH